jgi:uncharacterized membrane protein
MEPEKEFELERMITFSDALFAIAITLMIFDIKWPDIPDNLKGINLYQLFQPTIYRFLVFVLSFYYIGRSWSQHLRLGRLLRAYDQGLINRNLIYLFFITTFPFTASGLDHARIGFSFPLLLYSFNLAAVPVMHFVIIRYIFHKKPGLSIAVEEAEKKYIYTRGLYFSMFMVALFLLAILVSILTSGNSNYVYYVYMLIPLGVRYAARKANKYKPKTTAS